MPAGFDDQFVDWVGYPTGLAPTPDGRILITTQVGQVLIYDSGTDAIVPAPALELAARICSDVERGLLGVAVDPNFSANHFVYLFYTYDRGADLCGTDPANPATQPVSRVSRFVLTGNTIDPGSETVLLDNMISPTATSVGGDLNFGKDGYLYVSVGDGGCDYNNDSSCGAFNDAARDPNVLLGKIVRITPDGGVPPDNPFVGINTAPCRLTGRTLPGLWCQETYAWGLRNPFRFNMDPNAGGTRFFINDTGQDHWEEIDLGQAGADYGWNVREGRCAAASDTDCGPAPPGMTNPIFAYEHAVGCRAITGGAFVPDGLWPSAYDGGYLYQDFICGSIFLLQPNGSGGYFASEFATAVGYPIDMAFGPHGSSQALYYLQNEPPMLRRIELAGSNRAPVAVANANPTSGDAPLTVGFDGTQSSDPDNDTLTYDWDFGDGSPHATTATTSHVYQAAGSYTATLTVSDGNGRQDAATVHIDARAPNQLPPGFQSEFLAAWGFPTGMAFTPDGRLLLSIQTGELKVYENGVLRSQPAIDLAPRLCTDIERGLLGVAVDPAFVDNSYVYLYYTYDKGTDSCGTDQADPASQPVNRLARFVLGNNSTIDPASETVLLDNIPSVSGNHNAGDVHFGKDGYLYATIGDSGCDYTGASGCGPWNNAARYRNALVGKVVRITADGDIPIDNPYQGPGTSRCNLTGRTTPGDWCREIYATGLRNPFRFAFDEDSPTTRFFINDVGVDTWEEVDLGAPGADYGWNLREGPCAVGSTTNCGPPPAGLTNPIHAYDHSGGCTSITAGAFVPDGLWPAQYDGSYLYGDFVCQRIFELSPDGAGGYTSTAFGPAGGVVAMAFGPPNSPSKALYYMTWDSPPGLYRIVYTGSGNRTPKAVAQASPTSGDLPLTVDFDGTQSSDPDQQTLSFDWDFGDGSAHATTATASHQYTTAGTYTAKLTVFDGNGGQDTATIRIDAGNNAPAPSISTPAVDQLFRVGETIALTGTGTDPEDGTLPDSSLTWQVVKHHATHTHPFLPPTTGNGVSITTPIPEDFSATTNSYLEVKLTATDSQGLSTTVTRDLRPRLVDLSFATDPPGFAIDLNGAPAPPSLTSWDGWTLQLSTSAAQSDAQGQGHTFVSWSDGGAPSHPITTPPTDTTYTALFTRNYARPRGATPTRVPLVPAQRPCVAANSLHGPPLLHPSCSPVRRFSTDATIGTPEANGLPARSIGYVRLRTVLGDPDTPADEADVSMAAYIPDVFDEGLSDYVGDLRARTRIRLTDRQHGPSVAETGTVEDFTLNFLVPCTVTLDTSGSICSTQTTGDALIPGLVVESERTIWDLGPVRLYDHGPDGTIATADDALFATQGVFIP